MYYYRIEVNVQTGEISEVPLTAEELAEIEANDRSADEQPPA